MGNAQFPNEAWFRSCSSLAMCYYPSLTETLTAQPPRKTVGDDPFLLEQKGYFQVLLAVSFREGTTAKKTFLQLKKMLEVKGTTETSYPSGIMSNNMLFKILDKSQIVRHLF